MKIGRLGRWKVTRTLLIVAFSVSTIAAITDLLHPPLGVIVCGPAFNMFLDGLIAAPWCTKLTLITSALALIFAASLPTGEGPK